MSALTDGTLAGKPCEGQTAEEMTAARRDAERTLGRWLPVSEREKALYRAAGTAPPTR